MAKYSTKQRKLLLDYLAEHSDEQFTAKQIAAELGHDKISLSAVYRNLSELEKDDLVKRNVGENSREVYYRYVAAKKCRDRLHLSCRVCGKHIHMDEKSAEYLVSDILKNSGFKIDKSETVLYGVCEACDN